MGTTESLETAIHFMVAINKQLNHKFSKLQQMHKGHNAAAILYTYLVLAQHCHILLLQSWHYQWGQEDLVQ